jgi:hypothetical protein
MLKINIARLWENCILSGVSVPNFSKASTDLATLSKRYNSDRYEDRAWEPFFYNMRNIPCVPNAELANKFVFWRLRFEFDADSAAPPRGEFLRVQPVHSDSTVRRWTLAEATKNRLRPHAPRYLVYYLFLYFSPCMKLRPHWSCTSIFVSHLAPNARANCMLTSA